MSQLFSLGLLVERDTVRRKCLVQEHNVMSLSRAQRRWLDLEARTLTMRPLVSIIGEPCSVYLF